MKGVLKSVLAHFTCQGKELALGDVTLTSLAKQHGTPLYIYDKNIIRKKCLVLRNTMPKGVDIYYALKANPNTEIIRLMNELYDGFDVASGGEAERVIQAGVSPDRISFTGPGKRIAELQYVIDQQIGSISIESEKEFEHIRQICMQLGKHTNVLVRVNPSFDLSQSGMKMGGGSKQFGVDSERVPELIRVISNEKIVHFKGIHIFAGSQNLNADILINTFKKILEYAVSLSAETGVPLKKINMGGGFGIPYHAHEQELDLKNVALGLTKLIEQYGTQLGNPSFMIELGRFLVGECGVYLAQILYKKMSMGQVYIITDGGMHHHLAASGNLGQSLVRRSFPMTVANKQGEKTQKVHVTGPLCTPLDTFGYVELPEAEENDLIAVLQSGAYGYSASPHLFLSHPVPKEILV